MCIVLLPPGVYPIAVKYIISKYNGGPSSGFKYRHLYRSIIFRLLITVFPTADRAVLLKSLIMFVLHWFAPPLYYRYHIRGEVR